MPPTRPALADQRTFDEIDDSNGEERQLSDPAAESGPLRIAVEDAVMLALRNNRGLAVQQYRPLIVGTFEQLERAIYDPVLRAELSTSHVRRQQTSPATGTVFDDRSERQFGEVGVARRLPTGTEVGLDVSHTRADSDRVGEQHSPRVGVTLRQALLRGADREANLAGVRQAQLERRASEYELRGFVEALVADVERTYWAYALAAREIEIFQSSVELANQQLDETQRRVAVGVLAETELAAARAEVAVRREALINAQSALEQVRLRLLRLTNPVSEQVWDRPLELMDPIAVLDVPLDPVEEHTAVARTARPELNEARLRIEQGRLDVVRTRVGLLPRLDLFLTLGKSGFADSFGASYEELVRGRGYDLGAGLVFEYPLGNRAAEADHRRARLSQQQVQESLENLTQLVELDVRSAYVEVQRGMAQIEATAATRELREETLRAETAKFQVGTSTAFLVAQAQRDLLESQINEARALVSHRRALIELYRLEGSLLLRRGIDAGGGPER